MMWNIVTFSILIINVAIVWSYKLPTISNITQNQVRDVGGQVDLSCSVDDANEYPVLWLKHNINETETLFISTNTQLIMRDSRLSLRFDAASATYTLSIKDLEESDAGFYKCQVVVTPTVKVSKVVELQVRPTVTFDNSTRSTVTTENDGITQTIAQEKFIDIGGQLDLACSVHDAEDYPVLWIKYDSNRAMSLYLWNSGIRQRQRLISDPRFSFSFDAASATYTLSVTDMRETDAGLYQCKVARALGVEIVKLVNVKVRRPPIIFENSIKTLVSGEGSSSIQTIAQEQFIDIGGQVDLTCSVNGDRDYPVLWIKYDRNKTMPLYLSTSTLLVVRDSRFSLRFDAASATYTLSIKDLQETDAGLYQCKVAKVPSVDLVKEVNVHVRKPPIKFENSTKSLVSGQGGNTTSKLGFRSMFQKLTEANLEVVELKKKLIDEEIEQQLLRKSMLKELFGLQKENMLLTREILKSQLENKSKELNGTILAVPAMLP